MMKESKQHTDTISLLLIYTGGTIGMVENPKTGALENFDFDQLIHYVPEVQKMGYDINHISLEPPIDSSDISPTYWKEIAYIIRDNYDKYHGFVILHGTDTMSFTASALSFMLENLNKPVILTGSQLPIGKLRTDGKENLLTSIEIAAAQTKSGLPIITEVCIYFERMLMRGNRTTKINAQGFNAFQSHNFPPLAEAGIYLTYNYPLLLRTQKQQPLKVHDVLDENIVVLTLFPGIKQQVVENIMKQEGLRAILIQTYGAGNAPQQPWLVNLIKEVQAKGILVVNITQCSKGRVEMGKYSPGMQLLKAGVINGYDSTYESMITKLMVLIGEGKTTEELKRLLNTCIAGEITLDDF